MNFTGISKSLLVVLFLSASAFGQQRPLLTEDPRIIEDGSLVTEVGFGYQHQEHFPLSGLTGDHYSVFDSGLNFGLGPRAEFQMSGVVHHTLRLEHGAGTRNDWGDLVLSTKIKLVDEGRGRPIVTFRPTVVLPNSDNTKGIGTDTTNFFGSLLFGKTVGGAFVFGNLGLGILDDATRVSEQHDVIVYGMAMTVPVGGRMNIAAEWNGLYNSRSKPSPGGESRGQVRLGLQLKAGGFRWDVAATAGTTDVDHKAGVVAGMTREFKLHR